MTFFFSSPPPFFSFFLQFYTDLKKRRKIRNDVKNLLLANAPRANSSKANPGKIDIVGTLESALPPRRLFNSTDRRPWSVEFPLVTVERFSTIVLVRCSASIEMSHFLNRNQFPWLAPEHLRIRSKENEIEIYKRFDWNYEHCDILEETSTPLCLFLLFFSPRRSFFLSSFSSSSFFFFFYFFFLSHTPYFVHRIPSQRNEANSFPRYFGYLVTSTCSGCNKILLWSEIPCVLSNNEAWLNSNFKYYQELLE